MPVLTFDTLEVIPEELRGEAKQHEGKFQINVVGRSKLDEFRNNNTALARQVEDLNSWKGKVAPLVGDDVDKFATDLNGLRSTAQLVADGKLQTSDKIETEVTNRVKAKSEALEAQLRDMGQKVSGLTGDRDGWKSKYERSMLHQQVTTAVVGKDSVANPEALPDILSRAESLFEVQPDGKLIPKKDGQTIYGSDGASPMSVNEWLTKLVGEATYLGKSSQGSGATGNGNSEFGSEDFQKRKPADRIAAYRASRR